MVFSFIKYTQPAWQFNVKPKSYAHASCLYHPEHLPLDGLEIEVDKSFTTQSARLADIGYRAWNKGQLTWINKEIEQKIEALDNDQRSFFQRLKLFPAELHGAGFPHSTQHPQRDGHTSEPFFPRTAAKLALLADLPSG